MYFLSAKPCENDTIFYTPISVFLLCILLVATKNSESKNKFDSDLSGHITVGMAYEFQGTNPHNLNPNKSYHKVIYSDDPVLIGEADIEFSIDAASFLKGKFELEADYNAAGVRIKDCWIRFAFKKPIHLRYGYQRKVLGFEELDGTKSRPTMYKSLINRYIRSFGILDRDQLLRMRIKQTLLPYTVKYYALIGADGDVRIFGNTAILLEWNKNRLGLSNIYTYYWDNSFQTRSNSNVSVGSFEYNTTRLSGSSEIYFGLDPNATDHMADLQENRKVYFGALKLILKYNFQRNSTYVSGLEPLLSCTYISNDLKKPSKGYSEVLGGLILHLNTKKQVRWMSEGSVIYAHNYAGVRIGRYTWKTSSKVEIIW